MSHVRPHYDRYVKSGGCCLHRHHVQSGTCLVLRWWRVCAGIDLTTLRPAPYSEPANVDPEEAFVAALASCHMLWFLITTAPS